MLGGARRPPSTNWLSLACQALAEVIRIDERLRPYIAEQKRMLDQYLWMQECEAAIRKAYGPVPPDAPPRPRIFTGSPASPAEVLKQEKALAKSQLLIDRLNAKLKRR